MMNDYIFCQKFMVFIMIFLGLSVSKAFSSYPGHSCDTCNTANAENGISVFLDNYNGTDDDYIRQEIPFVSYVRDKELADVHIIISSHSAGQTGKNYIITLIGRDQFRGMDNMLKYWSSSDQTNHETRRGYTKMIKLGLAPYIANVENMFDKISLQYDADSLPVADEEMKKDPWGRWIFELYAGGYFDAEQTQSSLHIRYGIYADKITEAWKIRVRPYFNYNRDEYEIKDSTIVIVTRRDGFNGYLIKSISDHWGTGIFTNMLSSVYDNMDFQIVVSPAIEYSLFPYKEATRRSLAFAYRLDYAYNDYIDETIFGKTIESLWGQSLSVSADFRQTWGNIRAGITGSHHIHDIKSNRLDFSTSLDIRIFKGFSLTLDAEFDIINDQVSIPGKELTTEEILLKQRKRLTDYELHGHIGFTYTFGSSLSADYNPRL